MGPPTASKGSHGKMEPNEKALLFQGLSRPVVSLRLEIVRCPSLIRVDAVSKLDYIRGVSRSPRKHAQLDRGANKVS